MKPRLLEHGTPQDDVGAWQQLRDRQRNGGSDAGPEQREARVEAAELLRINPRVLA